MSVLRFFVLFLAVLVLVGKASAQERPRTVSEPKTYLDSLQWMLRQQDVTDETRVQVLLELNSILADRGSPAADDAGEQAFALAQQMGNWELAFQCIYNLALYADRRADYVAALDYSQQALAFAEKRYPPGIWTCYQLLGAVLVDAKDIKSGLAYMRKALMQQHRTKGVSAKEIGGLLINIANTFQAVQQYDSVLIYARRALPFMKQANQARGLAYLYQFQGEAYQNLKPQTAATLDSSTASLRRALDIMVAGNFTSNLVSTALALADQYRLQAKPVESQKAAELALKSAISLNMKHHKMQALQALAWAYADQGNSRIAYEFDAQAKVLRDSLFNSDKSQALAQLQVAFGVNQQRQQVELLTQKNQLAEEQNRVVAAEAQTQQARLQLLTQQSRASDAQQQANRASLELLGEQNRAAEAQTQAQAGRVQLLTQEKVAAGLREQQQHDNRNLLIMWLCVLGACLVAGLLLYFRLRRQSALLATANKINQQSAEEKEVLLQEIHHRVKNNLEIVNSLLSWQSSALPDPALVEVLRSSQSRIHSMALVHEFLYRAENLSQVRLDEYLAQLLHELHETLTTPGQNISITSELAPLVMEAKVAFNFGLLVNELITNTLKHAFQGRSNGHLHVELAGSAERFRLVVADDGVGMPAAQVPPVPSSSLGTRLIQTLSKQLKALLTVEPNLPSGTRVIIAQQ